MDCKNWNVGMYAYYRYPQNWHPNNGFGVKGGLLGCWSIQCSSISVYLPQNCSYRRGINVSKIVSSEWGLTWHYAVSQTLFNVPLLKLIWVWICGVNALASHTHFHIHLKNLTNNGDECFLSVILFHLCANSSIVLSKYWGNGYKE